MRYSIVALSAMAVGALAGPIESFSGFRLSGELPKIQERDATCMSAGEATKVANNFKDLINLTFNKTLAQTALTKDFTDYSDSVTELINSGCKGPQALTQPTFTNRAAFIKGQSGQPPIDFSILNLWHTCNQVFLRWRTNAPGTIDDQQPVTGIIAIEAKANPHKPKPIEPWLIKTVSSINSHTQTT